MNIRAVFVGGPLDMTTRLVDGSVYSVVDHSSWDDSVFTFSGETPDPSRSTARVIQYRAVQLWKFYDQDVWIFIPHDENGPQPGLLSDERVREALHKALPPGVQ